MDNESSAVIMAKLEIVRNEQVQKLKQEFKSLGSGVSRKISLFVLFFCINLVLPASSYFDFSEEMFYTCLGVVMLSSLVYSFAVHESNKINKRIDLLVKIIANDFQKIDLEKKSSRIT